ncbi:MAG: hypothetical protein LH629_00490 [Ignavibacteria bacterium]|nr:hypothetical protein [Ignavibacteria bacterium]
MIHINEIELASELADRELRKTWKPYKRNGIYIPIDYEDQEEKCIYYTKEAQEVYNELYEEFFSMILDCEEETNETI